MGDPKKQRRKYQNPGHPWEKGRIEEERVLFREYGFSNKKEIWKMGSKLRNIKSQVKNLVATKGSQAEKERNDLMKRVKKLGLAGEEATFENLLALQLKDILERRLQTIVFRKGLSRSMKQARQFIIHKHILVNGKKLTVPSYIVPKAEEGKIEFVSNSSLSNPDHPERAILKKKTEKPEEIKKK